MTSLLRSGKVRTTQAKASVLVAEFDELVTSVRRQKEKREQIRTVKRVILEKRRNVLFLKRLLTMHNVLLDTPEPLVSVHDRETLQK